MAPSELLLKTAKAYLSAVDNIDSDGMLATTTDNFYVSISPASARLGDDDGRASRDTLIKRFQGLKHAMSSLHLNITQEWQPNEATRQVFLQATGDIEFLPSVIGDDNKDEWVFKNEVFYVFTMNESGDKVEHLLEFVDSLAVQAMPALFGKAMKKLGHGELAG